MGRILWIRVQLQAASQAAARAYAAWQPEDQSTALARARRAAMLAMRPTVLRAQIIVTVDQLNGISSDPTADHGRTWLIGGLGHRLDVSLRQKAPWGLQWLWPHGLNLRTKALILTEESKERYASEN